MIFIRPLAEEHLATVASLHLHHLPTSFSHKPGHKILQVYYSSLMNQQGGSGFVAVKDNRVIGYVCGIWDPPAVKKNLIQTKWADLLYWSMAQVLASPSVMIGFVQRFKSSGINTNLSCRGYELRPIIVSPEERGTGVAAQLVRRLVQDATERGYSKIYLYTEKDNLPANAFYLKNRFSLITKEIRSGVDYLYYERIINNNEC